MGGTVLYKQKQSVRRMTSHGDILTTTKE